MTQHIFSEVRRVKARALSILPSLTRSAYAADVVRGRQLWSGADLQGKARKYGVGYAKRRRAAAFAVRKAGGAVMPIGNSGKLALCVAVGCDDWGNVLYQTEWGPAVARASSRLLMIDRT